MALEVGEFFFSFELEKVNEMKKTAKMLRCRTHNFRKSSLLISKQNQSSSPIFYIQMVWIRGRQT